jgi:hypothetical protein
MRCSRRTCVIVAGVGLLVAVARRQRVGGQRAGKRPTKWDMMRKRMEEMPEDFPPRVMYDNVETTRANTERILEILG